MKQNKIIEDNDKYLAQTYSQIPIILDGGKGVMVCDVDGNEYLDFTAGIAVNILGYGDEGYIKAIEDVLKKGMVHCSNIYYNQGELDVAKKLCNISEMDQAFFCNSGAEANESALKLARKYGKYSGERTHVISMKDSFHGRTFGSLSTTGQEKYQKNFFPLLSNVSFAAFNNIESVIALINDETCAIIVEPLQGEGGIIPAKKEFLVALRELCDKHDLILIFDEVQCGMGRCGTPLLYQSYGVMPDVVTLAKALAGGMPCGAMLTTGKANSVLLKGDHASTFGGNLVAMAASSYILDRLDEDFLLHVKEVGEHLYKKLAALKNKYPTLVVDVRGKGLMVGMQLSVAPSIVVKKCFEKNLLIIGAGADVLRFVPPLIITKNEIDKGISIIDGIFEELSK
jgi:predicted acetylornithine/succinylornithine family transaminase